MPLNESGTISTAIYVRLSRDPEGTRDAVERQEAACRKLAELRGWSVVRVYCDNDISAYNGKRRPGFEEMLKAVSTGEIDAVTAWHQDRVCRRIKDLSTLLDAMKQTRCRWATVTGGDIDPSTATGEMLATIIGAVAQQESAHKSERLRAKYAQMAERGEPGGRSRPFGYVDGQRTAIVEAEADLLRDAAGRVLSGEAVGSVAKDWTRRGIPTVTGRAKHGWSVTVLRNILISPELSGRRSAKAEDRRGWSPRTRRITADGKWVPILDVDTSDRLRALLTDPKRRNNGRPAAYLLTGGIAVCGLCGYRLGGQPREGIPCMTCKNPECGKIRVMAKPVEDAVSAAVVKAADSGALTELLKRQSDPEVVRKLAGVEARLVELADLWAAGELGTEEWKRARARLETDQKALSNRLEAQRRVEGLDGLDGPLAPRWDAKRADGSPILSLARKRAVIKGLVDAVVISPAQNIGKFDYDRIAIRWR